MSEQTPSQAEGERDDEQTTDEDRENVPRKTPSQAEGDDEESSGDH